MNLSSWKIYMQKRFKGSAKRNIQLSDLHIQVNDSAAVVSFKQRYLRVNYRTYVLKTLLLTHHQGGWTILREFIKRSSELAESAGVSIESSVENWRQGRQKGDLKTYLRSSKRKVLLSNIHVEASDSTAAITFKQRYQTTSYRRYGVRPWCSDFRGIAAHCLQARVAELKVENNHLPMERYIFEVASSIGPRQSTG